MLQTLIANAPANRKQVTEQQLLGEGHGIQLRICIRSITR